MNSKIYFIVRNIAKGLLWLAIFVGLYLFFQNYLSVDYLRWLKPVYENVPLVFIIFLLSEILIGIIPPEIFIIWALRNEILSEFLLIVGVLSVISYLSGITGYIIGHYLNKSLFYRFLKRRFLKKLDQRLQTFGVYLILIAALTPLPFSGVSMLIGSVRYPMKRFVFLALSRFLRFAIYAYVFWQAKV
ncbi:MAG: VTT domain-containing protein [Bacteroidales bacterium]|nr:VTT domain-containing protein [Bacteroidales bacterium]